MSGKDPAIWPQFEAFYIQSMLFNATSAVESISRVADVLNAIRDKTFEELQGIVDSQGVLDELQNIILQGGALSRYFWPSPGKGREPRGEQLRIGLGISDRSPLKNRKLRNALEHFDERLDEYVSKELVGYVLPQYVGPAPADEPVPFHLFRGFYLDTGVFTLLGQTYEMQPLADEIVSLYKTLRHTDKQGGRLARLP